jgi:pyridoxal phosphate enzyme (YggS family)
MSIARNYAEVRENIASAAEKVNRQVSDITLVVVTKTWPPDIIEKAYEADIRDFGENRAEELALKKPEMENRLGKECGIVWHAIGSLQSRKTNDIANYADTFHALDRLKIAQRLSRRLVENGRSTQNTLPIFLEVNISGEGTKAGIDCSNWEQDSSQRENLRSIAEMVTELPGLTPLGLMTMAPWQVGSQIIRSTFKRTRRLSEWLQTAVPQADWANLSMGMTDDYEIAIEEGATHVRVGRAIFGDRRVV